MNDRVSISNRQKEEQMTFTYSVGKVTLADRKNVEQCNIALKIFDVLKPNSPCKCGVCDQP